MGIKQRIALAAAILIVDLVVFFLPFSAIFLGYILIANPPWFRQFLESCSRQGPAQDT
jgi:hypothetical protein